MDWIAVGLAGGSLAISVAILVLVWLNLRSTHRAEQAGDGRLEMLREQQERLEFLREERRRLDDELEWRRSMVPGQERSSETETPSKSNGRSEPQ